MEELDEVDMAEFRDAFLKAFVTAFRGEGSSEESTQEEQAREEQERQDWEEGRRSSPRRGRRAEYGLWGGLIPEIGAHRVPRD